MTKKILAPEPSIVNIGAGFTSSYPALVFPAGKKPQWIIFQLGLCLWHGEDLKGHTGSGNSVALCNVSRYVRKPREMRESDLVRELFFVLYFVDSQLTYVVRL